MFHTSLKYFNTSPKTFYIKKALLKCKFMHTKWLENFEKVKKILKKVERNMQES